MEYLICIRPSITFRRFSQFLCEASPRLGKWRQSLSFESQREGLRNERVQSKRQRFRKITNHSVVYPRPSYRRNRMPSTRPLRQQLFTGRRSQVLRLSTNKTFVWVRDFACVWQSQVRCVCHNRVHRSRQTFFGNSGFFLRVVAVAAVDGSDLSGLLIISHSFNQ